MNFKIFKRKLKARQNTKSECAKGADTKKCCMCLQVKPIDEFATYKLKTGKLSLVSRCRQCQSKAVRYSQLAKVQSRWQTEQQTGLRRCKVCERLKPLDQFAMGSVVPTTGKRSRLRTCRECFHVKINAYSRKRYAENEEVRQKHRERLRRGYAAKRRNCN